MGKEYERKYNASPEILEAIEKQYGDFHPITMETSYYDTEDRSLGKLRWTLRRRMENGRSVCALKTPGKNDVRGEWEAENEDLQQGLKAICAMDVPEQFPGILQKGLVQVCGARFTRRAKLVSFGESTLELALDQGVFLGGGKEQPFSEVEIELKQGTRQDTDAFSLALSRRYGLSEGFISKFERALALSQEG